MLTPSLGLAALLRRVSHPAGRSPRRFRPRLEGLEDRLTPATFNVTTTADLVAPGDGKLSLREAISLANATDDADTIVLPAGVYAIERPGAFEDDNATGDFDITRPLTVKGPPSGTAVIDAAGLDRVFHAHLFAVSVTFTRLTIQGGSSTKEGGGIFVNDVELSVALTLRSCVVRANTASAGGGISAGAGQTTLIRSKVMNNRADGSGGGVFVLGPLRPDAADVLVLSVTDSVVAGNSAGGVGGGIDVLLGSVAIADSVVSDNFASFGGGGITAGASDVTLTGTTLADNASGFDGGALLAVGLGGDVLLPTRQVTLTSCTVTGNSTGHDGGGLKTKVSQATTLTGSTVSDNVAGNSGGGISSQGDLSLTDSAVSGNIALGRDNGSPSGVFAGDGGGIHARDGAVTLARSRVSGNGAVEDGGGLAIVSGSLSLITSTIADNRTLRGGGGGVFFGGASLTAERSTLSGNQAAEAGGGLLAVSETVATTAALTNVTVSGNVARGNGGGLSLNFGGDDTATLLNVTVTRNQAANGGGVVRTGGVVQLRNTVVAQNLVGPDGEGTDVAGGCVSLGFNLVGIAEGIVNVTTGDQFGSADNPIDARLAPLSDNGGPTLTHALRPGSRAIDRGSNDGAPARDQRGVARPGGGTTVDIGAFEFVPRARRRRRP